MTGYEVSVEDYGLVDRLKGAPERVQRYVTAAVGREGVNLLKAHFRQKDQTEANQLGGRRTHFWQKVGQSVQAPMVYPDHVVISINHPAMGHKVSGGKITAKRVSALTIPVSAKAYGRTARIFEQETGEDLFVVKTANAVLLATRNKGSKFFEAQYLLKKSVTQKPDPTALPNRERFAAALIARARSAASRAFNRPTGDIT